MDTQARIDAFLAGSPFAVVGASADRSKYGNKILRCYAQNDRTAFGVNPHEREIEGRPCFADVGSLPEPVHGVSIITPPAVTAQVIEDVARAEILHVWIQPGAESLEVLERCEALGLEWIGGGPCLLVALGYRE